MIRIIDKLLSLFPLWAILICVYAYLLPESLIDFKSWIIPLLSVIMLGMGMTLKWDNFIDVVKSPKLIATGVGLQYIIMPLSAFVISKLFGLSNELTAGMVLVGSSAGGTASNVMCYLAKGNLALSITLTMTSTILAVAATPLLCYLYLNQFINVPVGDMFLSILQIVIVPVLAGTFINSMFEKKLSRIKPVFPLISTLAIVLIIGIIVAINKDRLQDTGLLVVAAVMLHNTSGLALGYWVSRRMKFDETTCRTIAIEVGMQNSGLSVALAIKFFSSIAALPGAIFSIWHNLSGSFLASYWGSSKNRAIDD
jgi:BASS family bile acid:Na+ symporter